PQLALRRCVVRCTLFVFNDRWTTEMSHLPYTTLFRYRHRGRARRGRHLRVRDPTAGAPREPGDQAGPRRPRRGRRRVRLHELARSEEHTSELQSRENLVCRLLLEKKKTKKT